MDESVPGIKFDRVGQCNFCTDFLVDWNERLSPTEVNRSEALVAFIDRVKESGRGRAYDCVVGVSGGVDSSWVLVNVVRLGLRPLAVHMDNGSRPVYPCNRLG